MKSISNKVKINSKYFKTSQVLLLLVSLLIRWKLLSWNSNWVHFLNFTLLKMRKSKKIKSMLVVSYADSFDEIFRSKCLAAFHSECTYFMLFHTKFCSFLNKRALRYFYTLLLKHVTRWIYCLLCILCDFFMNKRNIYIINNCINLT